MWKTPAGAVLKFVVVMNIAYFLCIKTQKISVNRNNKNIYIITSSSDILYTSQSAITAEWYFQHPNADNEGFLCMPTNHSAVHLPGAEADF